MFGQVGETNLDLKFGLFGIPVRIHPLFWLIGILLGLDTLRAGPEFLMAWLLVLLVSILVHELGHASVAKYFGFRPHIVLHSLGGTPRMLRWGDTTGDSLWRFCSRAQAPGSSLVPSVSLRGRRYCDWPLAWRRNAP